MKSEEDLSTMRLCSNSVSQQRNTTASDMSVADLTKLVKSQFVSYQRTTKEDILKMGDQLSSQISQLRSDLTSDMQKLREDTNKTVGELVSSVERTKVEATHAVDRSMKRNDLIISGVPYTSGENLRSYIDAWCRSDEINECFSKNLSSPNETFQYTSSSSWGSLHCNEISNVDVINALYEIKSNAIGLDSIPLKFIKIISPMIVNQIVHLFNAIIKTCYFPSA